eukprot:2963511-Rhodomonas_salina.4
MPSCSDVCDDCKRQRERQSSSNLGEQQMYTRQGPQGSFVDAPYYPGRMLCVVPYERVPLLQLRNYDGTIRRSLLKLRTDTLTASQLCRSKY